MSELPTSPCRGCGKPVVWAELADGHRIPLDPRPPVYEVIRQLDGSLHAERDRERLVSHFATCSQANTFSSSRRRA